MAVTREAALEALQAKLSAAYAFTVVTRRVAEPKALIGPGQTALALVVHHETYERPSASKPPIRRVTVMAIIYIDVGADMTKIPDAVLNPIKDAIDAALKPDNAVTGLCTLGGAIYGAYIKGEVVQASGDKLGKGIAVMPIELVLP